MFIIETFVGPSAIHGNGVFAREDVMAGAVIWRFHPPFDQVLSDSDVADLPESAKDYIEMYAYRCNDLEGKLVLSGDHARFLNHSDDPNTQESPFVSIARRSIAAGDEITCDYGAFCSDWAGSAAWTEKSFVPVATRQLLPHRNLYARLKVSTHGVGVFALREINKGISLFQGDNIAVVRVPQTVVNEIFEVEVRRMYADFCPKRNGDFIAPFDFNKLTMAGL